VKGAKINVWDEIEPGYGSESSTEDVSSQIWFQEDRLSVAYQDAKVYLHLSLSLFDKK
jgi:hypothetical protein